MIEINLSPVAKAQDFTKIGPINLSMINLPLLVISIFIYTFGEGLVEGYFTDDIEKTEKMFQIKNKEYRTLSQELKSYDEVKLKVQQLEDQERILSEKIGIVQKIVDKRQNPYRVLKYIAEKTPKAVWITELEIDDKNLRIKGYSKTWEAIGNLIEELKASTHLSGGVNFSRPEDLGAQYNGVRVETFELSTTVTNFQGV